MTLTPTFALTPRSPFYYSTSQNLAGVFCFGADFSYGSPLHLPALYANDQFFFHDAFAANPALNYSIWNNRKKTRFLDLTCRLQDYGPHKELALVFGFDIYGTANGRVLVYSDAGLLHNQLLVKGDNQFLLEIDSVALPINLYFVHAGGHWLFNGITGYVI